MSRTSRFFGPPVTAGYQAPTAVYWSLFQTGQRPYLTIWDMEAMRREPQVQFGLRILKSPVRTAKWKVEGPDPKVNAFVDAQLKRVWQRALDKILLNLEYGNCAAEVAYDKEDDLVVFKELKDVYPRDAVPLQLRGELAGVEFRGSGIKSGKAARQYPPRSFWLANEPPFGNLYGRSRLSNAWEPWIEKRGRHGAVDIRRLWYVKNAYLGGVLRHPAGVLEDAQGRLISCQDYARETLEKLETGGVLILPNSKDESGDYLWVYEPPAANGTVEDIRDYPKDLDLEILIGMGIPPEVVQAAEVGAGWSGRSVPFLVYLTGEDTIVAQTVEGIDKQIVRPMVEENFGADAKYTVTPISLVDLAKEEEQQAQGGPQQAAMPGGPGAPGGAEQGQAPPGAEGAQGQPGQGQEPPQDVMQALSLAMLDAQADGDPDEVQSLASMAQGDGLDELMAHLGGEQEGGEGQQPGAAGGGGGSGWVQSRGPRGGHKLVNRQTGETRYGRLSMGDDAQLSHDTLRLADWQPYFGKRGPKKGQQVGLVNERGYVVYGTQKPGTRGAAPDTPAPAKTPSGKPVPAPPPKPGKPTAAEKRVASSEKAGAILGRALSGEKLTAEHLTELAGHLSALTVPQLRSWRQKLSISFGGGTKKEQMVAAIRQFAAGTPLKRKAPAKKPTPPAPPGKAASVAPAPAPKPATAPPTPAAAAEKPAPAVAPRATAGDAIKAIKDAYTNDGQRAGRAAVERALGSGQDVRDAVMEHFGVSEGAFEQYGVGKFDDRIGMKILEEQAGNAGQPRAEEQGAAKAPEDAGLAAAAKAANALGVRNSRMDAGDFASQLEAFADMDTATFDDLVGKHGITSNEYLRYANNLYRQAVRAKPPAATVNEGFDQAKARTQRAVASLREAGRNEAADWYEQHGLPLIDRARQEALKHTQQSTDAGTARLSPAIAEQVKILKKVYDSATDGSDEDAYDRKMVAVRNVEARLAKLLPGHLAKVAEGFGVRAGRSKTQTLRNIVDRLKERIDRFHRASDFGATGGGAGERPARLSTASPWQPHRGESGLGWLNAATGEFWAQAERPGLRLAHDVSGEPRDQTGKWTAGANQTGSQPEENAPRPIRRTADTTYEGVPKAGAKNISREEARDAIRWHDGMTLIAGSNLANRALPDAARPKLNAYQRGALQKYSYLNDGPLNGMLRGRQGWDRDTPYGPEFFREMHAQLQSAFQAAQPFPKPVPVVRGMKLPPEVADQLVGKLQGAAQDGQPISFKGYTSTTRPNGLMYRLGMASGVRAPFRGNITLNINATHGLDMAPHSQLTGEGELLLPHGAQFGVAGVVKKSDGYHVTLDQIPPGQGGGQEAVQLSDDAGDEAALRQFVAKHPEHLRKWVDTDADFVTFAGE